MTVKDDALLRTFLKPVQPFLDQEGVTEVVINRPGELAVETRSGWIWHDVPELDESWLKNLAVMAAGFTSQDINASNPICSTTLPGGERCQVVIPPAVPEGTCSFTIRKPSSSSFTLSDLGRGGLFESVTVTSDELTAGERELIELRDAQRWEDFLERAVALKRNIIISGATGSGKTTLSKALLAKIPPHERLLTIEDARELAMPHRNVVHMLYAKDGQGRAKAGAKELLESALRMRPDRILLQELRDGTAFFYMRNVNSGHPGSITTVHADSAELAFEQLTLLVKESPGGAHLAREDIRGLLYMLVDVIVQVKKVEGRFRMTEVYYDPIRKRQQAG